ncbi:MAG: ABC transporter permease [Thermoanaerobaculia bacterium]|nr:ABC transporter permease [Thermoanaerobaculia bacterium]
MNFLPLIFKNAFRKKTRTLLTVGSIVLPLLVICLMGTFLKALEAPDPKTARGSFRLVVRHRVSILTSLPTAYEETVRQLPGVEAVSDFNFFGGRYRDGGARNFFARAAVDPGTILNVFDEAVIVEGSARDWREDRTGCIVGTNLVARYGWKLGDRVVLVGDVFPMTLELTIRGVYYLENGTSATLFFDRRLIDERFPSFKGSASTIWIRAKDAAASERLGPMIDALFENSPHPTKTETENAFRNGMVSMLGNVKLLMTSIGAVIAAVILLIAGNTMAMVARERITEIAVFRTLGFQKSTILALVLGESVLIALASGVLGILIFVAAQPSLKRLILASPMSSLAATFRLYPEVLTFAFALAAGIGVLAGLVPALRSASRSIVDGLRQVA